MRDMVAPPVCSRPSGFREFCSLKAALLRLAKKRLPARLPDPRFPPMVQTLFNHNAVDEVSSTRDTYVKAYRVMLLARILDEKFASLYRMGKIHGGVFLGRGQEALSASVGLVLRKGDIFGPLIRDGAGRLAFRSEEHTSE